MIKKDSLYDLLKNKKIKIYIIHYAPLEDRKQYLIKKINELGLKPYVIWISQKKGQYSKDFSAHYMPSETNWHEMLKDVDGEKFHPLTETDFSVMMNHIKIYKKILKSKRNISLILEDDIILEADFLEKLKICISTLPPKFDLAYTDAGMQIRFPKKIKTPPFLIHKGFEIRTTASYFISLHGAKKLIELLLPIMPIDLELRHYEKKHNLEVYWLNGYLTYQGSVYRDVYKTSMRAPKHGINCLKKILPRLESKRYSHKKISNILIFLMDYLFIIPYRKIRLWQKTNLYKNRIQNN